MALPLHEAQRPFPRWAAFRLIISSRTLSKKFKASLILVLTWASTAWAALTYGVPARLSVQAAKSLPMALPVRYGVDDWLQVTQVVVIVFVQSPSSDCTLLEAGFCLGGNGSYPTAFRLLNGCDRPCFDRI